MLGKANPPTAEFRNTGSASVREAGVSKVPPAVESSEVGGDEQVKRQLLDPQWPLEG